MKSNITIALLAIEQNNLKRTTPLCNQVTFSKKLTNDLCCLLGFVVTKHKLEVQSFQTDHQIKTYKSCKIEM